MLAAKCIALLLSGLALGTVVDQWLLHTEKRKVYDWMVARWIMLQETPLPDVAGLAAHWCLKLWQRFTRWPVLSSLILLYLSGLATLASISLPFFLVGTVTYNFTFYLWPIWAGTRVGAWMIVGINAFFDGSTLWATLWALRRIRDASNLKARVGWVSIHLFMALACAALDMVALGTWMSRSPGRSFTTMITTNTPFAMTVISYGLTTLVPSAVFWALLLSTAVGRELALLVRHLEARFYTVVSADKPFALLFATLSLGMSLCLSAKEVWLATEPLRRELPSVPTPHIGTCSREDGTWPLVNWK